MAASSTYSLSRAFTLSAERFEEFVFFVVKKIKKMCGSRNALIQLKAVPSNQVIVI